MSLKGRRASLYAINIGSRLCICVFGIMFIYPRIPIALYQPCTHL